MDVFIVAAYHENHNIRIIFSPIFLLRKPFDEQALADKRRYEQEMGVFKPARDPNKPKRPSTAYFHFLADFRQKMKGSDIGHKDVIRCALVDRY